MNAPTPLQTITALAEAYAKRRAACDEVVTAIKDAYRALLRAHKRRLNETNIAVLDAHSELLAAIVANPQLFEKPRTFTVHGVKVGYQKQKGKILIADEDKTIALIRRHLTEEAAATLIKTEEHVIKTAAGNLLASDLKRVGIEISADTDKPVITSTVTDLEELTERLIEEAAKEES